MLLDNLKLGYGGTKEEMQRLLDDAEKLSGALGKDFDISNYADIVEAIHLVQEEMGIAGTTAREAASTIQGSLDMTKASWQNLITGMANEEANFEGLIGNFVDSVVTFGENILPRIEVTLNGAVQLIQGLFPQIVEMLPGLIETILPEIANGALSVLQAYVTALSENGDTLVQSAITVAMTLINGILTMLPDFISAALQIILALATGLSTALPQLLPTVVSVIIEIANMLTNPEMLSKILDAALTLILELGNGLMTALPQLVVAVTDIVANLVLFLTSPENLAKLISSALQLMLALASGLYSALPQLSSTIFKIVQGMIQNFKSTDWGKIGSDLIAGLKNGISRAWTNLKSWFKSLFGDLIGIAKKILGIASPSKVFKKLGSFTADGFGIGFEDTFSDVEDDIENALDFGDADYGIATATSTISSYSNGGRSGNGTQNVNVTVGIDDSANAMGLARALLPFLKIAEKEAYA